MKRLLASTAVMLALGLPALAQDYTPDPAAKPGGSITVTYKDDVATLDPAIGYDWQNWSPKKCRMPTFHCPTGSCPSHRSLSGSARLL